MNKIAYLIPLKRISPYPVIVYLTFSFSPKFSGISHSEIVPIGQMKEENSLLNRIIPRINTAPIVIPQWSWNRQENYFPEA